MTLNTKFGMSDDQIDFIKNQQGSQLSRVGDPAFDASGDGQKDFVKNQQGSGSGPPSEASGASGASGGNTSSAEMTRDQWQHFLDVYRPVEDDVLRTAMNTDFTAQGDDAGTLSAAASNAAKGTLARNISRSGGSVTGEERAAISRRQDLQKAKGVGQAENITRRSLSDSRTNLLSSLVQIGQGASRTAMAGASSVADMAAAREQQYIAGKAATTQGNISAAASAAALLIMFV